jgi:hypothetical protein
MPVVTATVVAVLPEVALAYAREPDGRQHAIGERTLGVPWHTLREGQAIVLELTVAPVRVLRVNLADSDRQ